MARIGDILSQTRKHFFTGREAELAAFSRLLGQKELSVHVLFIHGPAGQGKTTLLGEFRNMCRLKSCPHLYINGADVVPSASGLTEALIKTLGASSLEHFNASIEKGEKTFTLFIDAYEKIGLVDPWLRNEFLPGLPTNALVVISGRNLPGDEWTTDSGWQNMVKVISLQNFSHKESEEYISKRSLPKAQHNKILNFTHGNPLALSLVADLFAQNPDKVFSPEESPEVVQTLLNHFLQKAPSPAHRTALEICAITYITDQSVLASVMGLEDAGELFEWLKSLSFIETAKWGLYPHDLAREIIVTDLKWRNPDWYTHLYAKIKSYYFAKIDSLRGDEQRKFLFKLNYLHKNQPAFGPYYHWKGNSDYRIDLMKKEDLEPLAKMTEKFEGVESAKAFRFWANHPASHTFVWRTLAKEHCGFLMSINLNEIDEREKIKDEVMLKALQYARNNFHLRKGEVCTAFRFWMAAETHQEVSQTQSAIFLYLSQYYLNTPGLAVHLLNVANPQYWQQFLNYCNQVHIPALDGKLGHGFYMHDWRITPPMAWLKLLSETEEAYKAQREKGLNKLQISMLSESEFFDSIYEALKDYHNGQKIETNPLTRSRLVINAAGLNGGDGICAAVLKERLEDALKKIEQSPRNEKFHRVLYRTFINPVGSQEQTAGFLSLPFSTYRRHLKKAVNMVAEILWTQETAR